MALVLYILNSTVLLFTVMQISKSTGHGNEVCSDPLGMENGNIKNSQITVLSAFRLSNSGKSARLNKNLPNWGAWCPNVTNSDKIGLKYYDEYIQIDLLGLTTITKVAIQGRERQGGTEFTETYQISYSYDKRNWMYYREKSSEVKIFAGNTENTRVVKSKIDRPILARYVRIHPGYTYEIPVCLRLELYGCPNEEGILSYSIPQGHTTKNGKIHYNDTIYNGVAKNGILYNGTGLLTDGEIGPDDSKKDMGNGWVGWFKLDYVNITFEFYALKKFSDVTITINIDYTRRYFLFEKSKILFGMREDDLSQSSALQYCSKQVNATKKTIDFTLPLCGNVGKFVRMQLYTGNKWLLISEIKFNSDEAHNTEKTFQTCDSEDRCILNRPSVSSSTSTSTSTKCTDILFYSMPHGQINRDKNVNYNDTIYNGTARNGILYNGTGLLTDGEIGPVDSKEYKGKRWVGWNQTFSKQDGVNITFEFCSLQKFNDVSIVININNEYGNFLFNNTRILFSPTADGFSGSSVLQYFTKQLQLQTVMIGNVNVKLPLCGNIAKFVRIQLYPGSGWIVLSEIQFNSVPVLATDPPTVFKTCFGTSNNPFQPTETSSAHLLYILIALICVFCVIGLVILALLLTRRKVQPPTRNEEVSLEVRAPSVLNNGNDDVPEASASLSQTPNYEQNQPEEEDEIGEGYEYPSLPESGYVISVHSAYPAPGYTSLVRTPAPENDHQYQKLLKSSREPPNTT